MKKFKVALLANLKKNAPVWEGMPEDRWDDLDSEKTVLALVDAIRASGHTCEFFEGNLSLVNTLGRFKPDICFNICESHYGDAREAQVPALLEMMRLPYTGSRVLTLALALDKPMTKRILFWHELPTPAFQTFERPDEPIGDDITFPLFVKPRGEGTGMGVTGQSVVNNEAELRERVAYIHDRYKQSALVESFIDGREVTVGLVGNLNGPVARRLPYDPDSPLVVGGLHFFPPLEVNLDEFSQTDIVYSNRLKVDLPDKLDYLIPAPLEPEMIERLNWLAAAVFRVIDCLDVARVDFRLDKNNDWKPYILEVNPLPGLTPGISDIVMEAGAEGIDHPALVNMILETALKRYGMI